MAWSDGVVPEGFRADLRSALWGSLPPGWALGQETGGWLEFGSEGEDSVVLPVQPLYATACRAEARGDDGLAAAVADVRATLRLMELTPPAPSPAHLDRVYPTLTVEQPNEDDPDRTLVRLWQPPLNLGYGIEAAGRLVMLSVGALASMGVDLEQLHAVAMRNLEALPVRLERIAPATVAVTGGVWPSINAVQVLLPETMRRIARVLGTSTVHVALPDDSTILAAAEGPTAVATMAASAWTIRSSAENPLTSGVLRWVDGEWCGWLLPPTESTDEATGQGAEDVPQGGDAQAQGAGARAQFYAAFLRGEGLAMEQVDAETLTFTFEGADYRLTTPEDDPHYVHIARAGLWPIGDGDPAGPVAVAALTVTARVKVAKVYLTEWDVVATAEAFVWQPATLGPVLLRHLRALQVAVAEFQRILEERGVQTESSVEGRDPSEADEVPTPAAPEVYLFRMQPNGVDLVPAAVGQGLLMTGWSRVTEALDTPDFPTLKERVRQAYFTAETPGRTVAANAAGLWNFCRMRPGDLVVVPHGRELYVGTIKGDAYFDGSGVAEDSAHRRPVSWLGPFPRAAASPALQSSCRTLRTSACITNLLGDVRALIGTHRSQGAGTNGKGHAR